MNADRRKALAKPAADFSHIKSQLETIRDEEQEAYDNLPESLQGGDRGEAIQEAITALDSAWDAADELESYIDEAQNA